MMLTSRMSISLSDPRSREGEEAGKKLLEGVRSRILAYLNPQPMSTIGRGEEDRNTKGFPL